MFKKYSVIISLFFCLNALSAEDLFHLGIDAYNTGNYPVALENWKKASKSGNLYATVNVGSMYLNGHGVIKNPSEAFRWYREAAIKGEVNAQHATGKMYETGEGVAVDLVGAATWYSVAASRGNSISEPKSVELTKNLLDYEKLRVTQFVNQCKNSGYVGCQY